MLALVCALTAWIAPQTAEPAAPPGVETLLGTWDAELVPPLPDGSRRARFALWPDGASVRGGLRIGEGTGLLSMQPGPGPGPGHGPGHGSGQPGSGSAGARFDVVTCDGYRGNLECAVEGDAISGTLSMEFGLSAELAGVRRGTGVEDDLRLEVDLAIERPVTIDRDGLPESIAETFQADLLRTIESEGMVGVSVAILLDYEVVDIRSVGWQDFARRTPASQRTRYRWASISKPLTAVAALQLVEGERLDLDRDVRGYVPEFPAKQWVLTARHLLTHQGGVVHYQHEPRGTEREYDDPNPFRSRIAALDVFRESPLLFEPGTQYSYSTHGYALLGAVVERAGAQRFADQVRERIVEPLGMTTLQPDFHQSVSIPDQAVGYVGLDDGRVFDSGDSNVAWKLAGGGFISNVEDLALFGLGLMEDDVLTEATRREMFTPRTPASGEATNYGYGITMRPVNGFMTVGHSGSQRKARTCLRVVPEIGVGIAVMTNTEGTDVEAIAMDFLGELIQ